MKINIYLLLSILCFALLLCLCNCNKYKNYTENNEMQIMNTVIIDGVKCYSYTDGNECKFIPVPMEL